MFFEISREISLEIVGKAVIGMSLKSSSLFRLIFSYIWSIFDTVIIRRKQSIKDISLRDVTSRRKNNYSGSEIFKSASVFPDFVILSKDFKLLNREHGVNANIEEKPSERM